MHKEWAMTLYRTAFDQPWHRLRKQSEQKFYGYGGGAVPAEWQDPTIPLLIATPKEYHPSALPPLTGHLGIEAEITDEVAGEGARWLSGLG
jgi:hypothetical protein